MGGGTGGVSGIFVLHIVYLDCIFFIHIHCIFHNMAERKTDKKFVILMHVRKKVYRVEIILLMHSVYLFH